MASKLSRRSGRIPSTAPGYQRISARGVRVVDDPVGGPYLDRGHSHCRRAVARGAVPAVPPGTTARARLSSIDGDLTTFSSGISEGNGSAAWGVSRGRDHRRLPTALREVCGKPRGPDAPDATDRGNRYSDYPPLSWPPRRHCSVGWRVEPDRARVLVV